MDHDSIPTEEDRKDLVSYRKEKKVRKLVSHEAVKKDIGIVKIDKRDSVYD